MSSNRVFPEIKLQPVFVFNISSTQGFLFNGRWQEQPKWHSMIRIPRTTALQKCYQVTRIFEPQTKTNSI